MPSRDRTFDGANVSVWCGLLALLTAASKPLSHAAGLPQGAILGMVLGAEAVIVLGLVRAGLRRAAARRAPP